VPQLLLLLAVILALGFLLRWFVVSEPRQVLIALKWSAAILGIMFVVYVVLAKRWSFIPALILFGLPWIRALGRRKTFAKNAAGPTPGQTSDVETEYLAMVLDHDSGDLGGDILKGTFAGRRIEDLSIAELLVLRDECVRNDQQSVSVIEAFLDRQYGPDWRDASDHGDAVYGRMSVDEAYQILGLEPGADRDEIERVYRLLMQKMHPDHGGSDYLASKINQAKDVLLD
jgi:hypothetical protein